MAKRFTNGIKRKKFSAIAEIQKLDLVIKKPNLLELHRNPNESHKDGEPTHSLFTAQQRQSLNESMFLDGVFTVDGHFQSQSIEQFCEVQS